jgi:hypothetical protein
MNKKLILLHLGAAFAALNIARDLIDAEAPPGDVDLGPVDETGGEVSLDPAPVDPVDGGLDIPHYHVNGWGLFADDQGLVGSVDIDPIYARLPLSVQTKVAGRFVNFESFFTASYPTPHARLLADKHLSSRRVTPILPGNELNWNVARYTVEESMPERMNYDAPPWAQMKTTWHETEIRDDAWAMDWNPTRNHAFVVAIWKERARAELIAQGFVPRHYGL